MKILVCISSTPDTTSKISFKNEQTEFNTEGVQFILNPYDEWYALVRGLELKEQLGGTVTVIHVGPANNDPMIRKALAIGADDAVRINIHSRSTWTTAKSIANYAADQHFDLILTGKETIDYQTGEVGAMIAELLDLPFVPFASKMEATEGKITCNRDIEGGVEVIEVMLPAVVSASKGMAEQRIPNMKGIMTAKNKPLIVIDANAAPDLAEILSYELPPPKQGVIMIEPDEIEDLVRILHEKEKVI